MNIYQSIKRLKKHELVLWWTSIFMVIGAFLIFSERNIYNLITSLIGVTALIFVAKGDVIGQILTVIFALFYGFVSYKFRYYGEMLTYMGMTAPIALGAVITWIRNPYKTGEVRVRHTTPLLWTILSVLALLTTSIFYLILKKLSTPNLIPSTISVTTSFMASGLTLMRSSYYALFYAANDIVLIVLWVLATINDTSYLPMVICFTCFLFNDLYGFINWQKMKSNQK